MLGPPKPRRLDQPIAVSLQALVPANNDYRHLETTLDLSFVRDWTRKLHAERGRPSIDPVVFVKLQLMMFCEVIRAERQLVEPASLHLAHRWYLGTRWMNLCLTTPVSPASGSSWVWRRCGANTRRRPARRRSANGRYGLNRSLSRLRSGTACACSDSEA
jgi:hypothetical protein